MEKIVYLDTNIMSRIADGRVNQKTLDALETIAESTDVTLVTSIIALQEFIRCTNPKTRVLLKLLYKIAKKVPTVDSHSIVGIEVTDVVANEGFTISGKILEDPLIVEIKHIFDEIDSEHIFQAIKSQCDFFLTLDSATILTRLEEDQERVKGLTSKMQFVGPAQLAEVLQADNNS